MQPLWEPFCPTFVGQWCALHEHAAIQYPTYYVKQITHQDILHTTDAIS